MYLFAKLLQILSIKLFNSFPKLLVKKNKIKYVPNCTFMKIKNLILSCSLLLFLQTFLSAQVLYNNGVSIKITKGAFVYVDGTVQNQSGVIDVDNVTANSQLIVEGNFVNNATAGGSGYYRVIGDWLNNNTFTAGSGTVFLEGPNQLISGSVSTYFYNLTLDGTGKKTQTIHQYSTGILDLNDVELATQTFGFFVQNTGVASIIRGTGFVSSLNGGFLSRQTNTTGIYLFPVGSSVGTLRYRPVEITPTAAAANTYTARLANLDATTEAFDRSLLAVGICEINPLFYHQINRTVGATSANIDIYFDNTTDGDWDGMSNWGVAPNQWNKISGSTITAGAPLDKATSTAWNNFSQLPYGLFVATPTATIGSNSPICEGGNIQLTETGGDAVSWAWTGPNGFSSTAQNPILNTVVPAANGDYTVIITDGNGCTATATTTVKVDAAVDATITPDGPFCITDAAVTLSAVSSGGTWSGTGITNTATGEFTPATAGAGNHVIQYDVSNGSCSDSDTETIHVDAAVNPVITAIGPFCETASAVALTAAPIGGTWSGTGVVGSNFNPALANIGNNVITYNLTVGACSGVDTETIHVDSDVDATISAIGPFCETAAAVTLTAVSSGGIWSGTGVVGNNFDPSTAVIGNNVISYIVTNGACSDSDTETIIVNSEVFATITPIGPFCESEDPVLLTAVTPGGTWSGPGVSGNNFDPDLANIGVNNVQYSIINGACSDTDNINVQVDANPAIPTTTTDCTGGIDAGIITITSPLGAQYEYSITGTFQSGVSFGPLLNGTYTVTVSNTTTGCTTSGTNINLDCGCANPTSLTLSSISDNTCTETPLTINGNTFGGSATQVTLSHNGNGDLDQTTINVSPFSFTYTPDPLDAGSVVTITVTTNNPEGAPCAASTQNFSLTVEAIPDANAGSNSPVCVGEQILFTENGGDATSWAWTGPNAFASPSQNPNIAIAALSDDGTYTVIVTDGNGCTNTDNVVVVVNKNPAASTTSNSAICVGDNLNLFENGGEATSWSWDGPNSFVSSDQNPVIPAASILADGIYSVTVTDINGCTISDNLDFTVNANPVVNAGSNSPICVGENLNLTETGGAATSWDWDGPDGFNSTDQNPIITSATILADGSYSVTISDINSCSAIGLVDVTVNANPTINVDSNSPICEGDDINLNEDAGFATDWNWTGPNGFTSDLQSPSVIAAGLLADGFYIVSISDANGCTNTGQVDVTVNAPPTAPVTSVDCSGGEDAGIITVTSPLGSDYTYSITGVYQAGTSFGPLANGTYTVTVQDINTGCTAEGTLNNLSCGCINPPTLDLSSGTSIACGQLPLSLSGNSFGGSATEVYLSHNGNGDLDQTLITSSPFTFTYTPDVSDIGTNVTITVITDNPDGLPCIEVQSTFVITVVALPNVLAGGNTPICEGEDIHLTETGGDAVSWAWDGPNSFATADQNPEILAATIDAGGMYSVTITDANDCQSSSIVAITVNPTPATPVTSIDCTGGFDAGIITVTAPIGAEYEYSITGTFQTSPVFGPLADGNYTVTVSDVNTGCSVSGNIINLNCGCANPTTLNIADATGNTCPENVFTLSGNTFGGSATEVSISHNGYGSLDQTTISTSPFEFTYTPDAADAGTTVTITVTTDNPAGDPCTSSVANFDLIVYSSPVAIAGSNSPICDGEDLSITETGTDAITWAWSGPFTYSSTDQNPTINAANLLSNGTYTVVISDANGCVATDDVLVLVIPIPDPTITNPGTLCSSGAVTTLEAATAGGTWSGDGVNPLTGIFDPGLAGVGNHEITYTIGGACGDSDMITISVIQTADATINPVDTLFFSDPVVIVSANSLGGVWSGIGINELTGEFTPSVADIGDHEIFYTIEGLCGAIDSIIIVVIPDIIPDLLIPDVLTPNDDGYNDTWRIQGIQAFENVEIVIFNRWGDDVFEFTGTGDAYHEISNQWDGIRNGKELPFGTYVYLLILDNEDTYKGTVTIIR